MPNSPRRPRQTRDVPFSHDADFTETSPHGEVGVMEFGLYDDDDAIKECIATKKTRETEETSASDDDT